MENFFKDIRYGVRMLSKNLGVTLVAIVTLALGIGANTGGIACVLPARAQSDKSRSARRASV